MSVATRPAWQFSFSASNHIVNDANLDGIKTVKNTISVGFTISIFLDILVSEAGTERSIESQQMDYFRALIRFMNSLKIDGETCLLRFLCEAQHMKMFRLPLLGKIIERFFTINLQAIQDKREYVDAIKLGKRSFHLCSSSYLQCPFGLYTFDSMS